MSAITPVPESLAWRLRAWDDPALEQEFVVRDLIAMSADEVGPMTDNPSDREIRRRLEQSPALKIRKPSAFSTFSRYWRTFLTGMRPGDVVAVPISGRRVCIGEIAGPHRYLADEPEPRLRHVRDVKWLLITDRSRFDEDLRRVLNCPGTVCRFRAADAAARLRGLSA